VTNGAETSLNDVGAPTTNRTTRHRLLWGAVAVVALVAGVATVVGTFPSKEPNEVVLSMASSSRAFPTPTGAQKAATRLGLKVPVSDPATLVIPAIGVRSSVGSLGLQANGQVMVPTSTHVVDWYRNGPTPGTVGSAVILGHVDSYLGPGTFFNLKLLKAGDAIDVTLVDGTIEQFAVSAVIQYAKAAFPDQLVYGSHGTRSLQLVTCGGTFNHLTGHYEANVVVFSQLVSATVPTGVEASRE
jgi:hypothetical protein